MVGSQPPFDSIDTHIQGPNTFLVHAIMTISVSGQVMGQTWIAACTMDRSAIMLADTGQQARQFQEIPLHVLLMRRDQTGIDVTEGRSHHDAAKASKRRATASAPGSLWPARFSAET